MRAAAVSALGLVLGLAARGVGAESLPVVESIGAWQLAGPEQREWVLRTRARGTVASPDVCRWAALGGRPENVPPAEAAAIRSARAACLIFTCKPGRDGERPRYALIVHLFGATGPAYEALPKGAPPLRAEIRLSLDSGSLRLPVGLIEPIHVQPFPNGNWSLVPFNVWPVERGALEHIVRSRRVAIRPINQFFAAYIWAVPFTSGAYAFDLSGGDAALARFDEHCR